MKYLEKNQLNNLPGKRLKDNDSFSFRCHSGLECFNRCCRNLNLFLYPYDVVRLKNNIGISSEMFLDDYVDIIMRESNFFPEVLLKMSEDEERLCPFLTDSGCSVYPDRPDTCRSFPVEHGLLFKDGEKKSDLIHLFRPPDFCLGQKEDKKWTIKSWSNDQDAETYIKMTVKWARLKALFQTDPWSGEGIKGPKGKMAFMSVYNIDMFRKFIFNSSFLNKFKVKKKVLKEISTNDDQLLKFAFKWIGFYLWGIKTKSFKPKLSDF